MKATVTKVLHERSYGFAVTGDGQQIFYHKTQTRDFDKLVPGDAIEFDETRNARGIRAVNVVLTSREVSANGNNA